MEPRLNQRLARFAEAYMMMADRARYRPQAPGDGCGSTYLTKEQEADPERLMAEAIAYANQFGGEDDARTFNIGCSNFTTNRALVFVLEAARSLCGGKDDLALDLLKMALDELDA
jgi:hypothetical protein